MECAGWIVYWVERGDVLVIFMYAFLVVVGGEGWSADVDAIMVVNDVEASFPTDLVVDMIEVVDGVAKVRVLCARRDLSEGIVVAFMSFTVNESG